MSQSEWIQNSLKGPSSATFAWCPSPKKVAATYSEKTRAVPRRPAEESPGEEIPGIEAAPLLPFAGHFSGYFCVRCAFFSHTFWKINGRNLKFTCLKREIIFQTFIFEFHGNFQGCKSRCPVVSK